MPSLTFKGAMRLQIEAVRACSRLRGQNLGQKMLELAIHWGKELQSFNQPPIKNVQMLSGFIKNSGLKQRMLV